MASDFPTKAEIARVVETARALGMVVAGIEVGRGGVVRTLPPQQIMPAADNAFDRWMGGQQKG